MLELFISILMSLGINFTTLDTGQVQISDTDYILLQSSEEFQNSEVIQSAEIVINDGIDPSALSSSSK